MKAAKYLVTGGAGFIGSHAVEALVCQGTSVTVLDNLSTGRIAHLSSLLSKIEFIEGDIRDAAQVEKAVNGSTHILHFAAQTSVSHSISNPLETFDVNLAGTSNLLESARKHSVKKFVFASSAAVYGNQKSLPVTENHIPVPESPYGASKLAGEHLCHAYSRSYGIESVCLRFFNIFGPRQPGESGESAVIPMFIRRLNEGLPLAVFGDGTQTRDFVYVDDVVRACMTASASSIGCGAEAVNIASGRAVSILETAKTLSSLFGMEIPQLEFKPPRPGDIYLSCADITKAGLLFGFVPVTALADGLAGTLRYYSKSRMESAGHSIKGHRTNVL